MRKAAVVLSILIGAVLAALVAGATAAAQSEIDYPRATAADNFGDLYLGWWSPVFTDTDHPWYHEGMQQRPGNYTLCPNCWEMMQSGLGDAWAGTQIPGDGTTWEFNFTTGRTFDGGSPYLSIFITDQEGDVTPYYIPARGAEEYFTAIVTHTFEAGQFYDMRFSGRRWIFDDITVNRGSEAEYLIPYLCQPYDDFFGNMDGWAGNSASYVPTVGHIDLGAITWNWQDDVYKVFPADVSSCVGFAFWSRGYDETDVANVFTVTVNSSHVYTGLATANMWTRHIIEYPFSAGTYTIRIGGLENDINKNRLYVDDFFLIGPDPTPTPPPPTSTPTPFVTSTPQPTATPGPAPTWPPPIPLPDPGGGGIPAPIVGTGGECLDCTPPTNFLSLVSWIAWLGCLIANLFTCNLYYWLLDVINTIYGVFQWVASFVAWLPGIWQAGLSWLGSIIDAVTNGLGNFLNGLWESAKTWFYSVVGNVLNSPFVQTVWGYISNAGVWWDVIKGFIAGAFDLLGRVFSQIVDAIVLIFDLIDAVISAFGQPPPEIVDVFGMTNEETIMVIVLLGLSGGDAVFAAFAGNVMDWLTPITLGLMTIGVIAWTLKTLQDILPI